MADIVLPYTITPDTLADADEVQGNFDELALKALNKTGDTATGTVVTQELHPSVDSTYDLGTTALRYRVLYVDSIVGAAAANNFGTIAVSGQSDVVADASGDTLTFVAGTGITITTTPGSDSVTITSSGGQAAGSSAINFAPGGTIYQSVTQAGNVGAGEDTLYTKSLAAALLANDGERLTFRASGVFANTANEKRIKVKYGATTIFDMGSGLAPGASGTTPWILTGTITRTGATAQRAEVVMNAGRFSLGLGTVVFTEITAPGETLTGAITFLLTGEGVATDDIILYTIAVEWWGKTSN